MKPPFKLLFLTAVVALCGACSSLRPPEPVAADYWLKPARVVGRAESLLLYYDYARALPAAELGREQEALRQSTTSDKSDFTRLRYALLLSLPAASVRDRIRAQQLLEPLSRDAEGRDPALRALALLLVGELAERRRLEDSLQSATQRQRDEQLRANDLEQKLEALKSIEKSLIQRDRKTTLPAPTGKSQK
jgi:hypothetical protein